MLPAFERPSGDPIELGQAPRLASWNRSDHPDQIRLRAYVEHVQNQIASGLSQLAGPITAMLDVGLPSEVDLLTNRDLDNYLDPIASKIGPRVVSWWGTKRHAEASSVRLDRAVQASPDALVGWNVVRARTTASATTREWKEQISEQIAGQAVLLPAGAVHLQIGFTVSTQRNWIGLWKPAIDSLDAILGRTHPEREFHPRDDRVTLLGLHRMLDPQIRHSVELTVWSRHAGD